MTVLEACYQQGVKLAMAEAGLLKEAGPTQELLELARRSQLPRGGIGGLIRRRPLAARMLAGGATGAATGGAIGAASGEDNRLRNALVGALAGGALGTAGGAGLEHLRKNPKSLTNLIPKRAPR